MKYNTLIDFMYEVGNGVGEFLPDEQKAGLVPLALADIVRQYVSARNGLNIFLLKWEIKRYISTHMTSEGLVYGDPFDEELSFAEDYFEGDLLVFLTRVLQLLDSARRER